MKLIAVLLLCSPLGAQTFRILTSNAQRGAQASLSVLLISPAGNEPVALQWKVALSPGVAADLGGITEGESAAAAQKRIVCAPAPGSKKESLTFSCILSGGQKSIANGVVFQVKYRVGAEAKRRPPTIRISDAIAASGQSDRLRKTDIPAVSASLDIQ